MISPAELAPSYIVRGDLQSPTVRCDSCPRMHVSAHDEWEAIAIAQAHTKEAHSDIERPEQEVERG